MLRNIAIAGRKRSGKDTAANYLVDHHGYVRHGFADPLKDAALALDPWIDTHGRDLGGELDGTVTRLSRLVEEDGWERAKDAYPEVRRILQRLGDEAGRQVHGEMTWINQLLDRVEGENNVGRPVVVPDVRYWNEAWYLDQMGFTLIRITRPGYDTPTPGEHTSEKVERLITHVDVSNDQSVESLCNQVGAIATNPR